MLSCNCSITDFKESVFPTAYLLIFILGTVGHLVSMYIFYSVWRQKRGLTTVNQFMVNLLVSDLMLVCSLPFRASYYLLGSRWIFGRVACKVIFYIFYLNMNTSIYFLVSPKHHAVFGNCAALPLQTLAKMVSWTTGLYFNLAVCGADLQSFATFSRSANASTVNDYQCMELRNHNQSIENLIIINNATMTVGFVVPLGFILWCSVCVAYKLWKPVPSQRNISISRKKAFALVIISLSFFIICFLPYNVMRTIFLYSELDVSNDKCGNSCESIWLVRKAAVVTLCLCVAHSCLDPILFFFVGEHFRTFFAKLLRRKTTDTEIEARRGQSCIPFRNETL